MDRETSRRPEAPRRRALAGSGLPEALVALLLLAVGLLAGASGLLRAVRGGEAAVLRSTAVLHAGEFAESVRIRARAAVGVPQDAWRSGAEAALPRGTAATASLASPAIGVDAVRASLGWDDPDGSRATAVLQVTAPAAAVIP